MTDLRQAAQAALEALEATQRGHWPDDAAEVIDDLRAAVAALVAERDALKAQLETPPEWHSGLKEFGLEAPTPRAFAERMYARWSNRMDTITVERDVLRRQLGKCLKKNDALRQDAERFRAIRQCRKTVQLYVYEVADDPFSGGWSYKNDPEDFDKFADAAMKEQK